MPLQNTQTLEDYYKGRLKTIRTTMEDLILFNEGAKSGLSSSSETFGYFEGKKDAYVRVKEMCDRALREDPVREYLDMLEREDTLRADCEGSK